MLCIIWLSTFSCCKNSANIINYKRYLLLLRVLSSWQVLDLYANRVLSKTQTTGQRWPSDHCPPQLCFLSDRTRWWKSISKQLKTHKRKLHNIFLEKYYIIWFKRNTTFSSTTDLPVLASMECNDGWVDAANRFGWGVGRHLRILTGMLFIEHTRRPPHHGSQICIDESHDATVWNFSM